MKSYITSIGTATPKNKANQQHAAHILAYVLDMEEREERRLAALFRATGIETRYSVVEDYLKNKGEFTFFPNNPSEEFPTVGKRMKLFEKAALPLAVDAIEDCFSHQDETTINDITHLIVVSCTGMYAPGLDIEIIQHYNLRPDIKRTAINFMGCYAALNALKVADAFCKAEPDACVLIVCLELCTLHFQKDTNKDQLLSCAIFSDGAAAVLVKPAPSKKVSLSIEAAYSTMALHGLNEMAWHITDEGFTMTLTSYVPILIKEGIKELTDRLLQKVDFSEINYFAIHPGGRKILEVIEEELGLTKEDNRHAYEVLHNYGNMSSPTILFVLNSIFKNLNSTDRDKKILSFAFGPGLTLESMLFKVN